MREDREGGVQIDTKSGVSGGLRLPQTGVHRRSRSALERSLFGEGQHRNQGLCRGVRSAPIHPPPPFEGVGLERSPIEEYFFGDPLRDQGPEGGDPLDEYFSVIPPPSSVLPSSPLLQDHVGRDRESTHHPQPPDPRHSGRPARRPQALGLGVQPRSVRLQRQSAPKMAAGVHDQHQVLRPRPSRRQAFGGGR
jgi:hypothetical protein